MPKAGRVADVAFSCVEAIRPSTASTHSASTAWPKAFAEIEATGEAANLGHAEGLALLLEREASLP
ncbi:hypothetical protein ACFKHW_30615 [Bradyrhizobium lupini]|uniref:hypothetical protein n=1 Tax=Rhizobium lupini TaxID=136996 RepID=UPI00366CCE48